MNGEQRLTALEGRVDRFETRVERELAQGSRTFARREVVDRMERELRSDVGDIKADVAAIRADLKAVRNIIIAAILTALMSGVISLGVWAVTT